MSGQEAGQLTTYFMVRIQRPLGQSSGPFTGAIERLGTGEKRQFGSEEELLSLLHSWAAGPPNMQHHGGPSKPPDAG